MLSGKLLETNPRPLDCCHAISFVNRQYKLSCPVKNDLSYVNILVLDVGRSGDVGDFNNLFNIREYVDRLLDNFFVLEEPMGN